MKLFFNFEIYRSHKYSQFPSRSIARTDLDISYITSRIIVMPYPSEGLESAYKTNHIDDVRVSEGIVSLLYIAFCIMIVYDNAKSFVVNKVCTCLYFFYIATKLKRSNGCLVFFYSKTERLSDCLPNKTYIDIKLLIRSKIKICFIEIKISSSSIFSGVVQRG